LGVPSEFERTGDARRLHWTLHYWMNSHLDFGDFPAPDLDEPDTARSVWGWSRCRKHMTQDDGQDRFINRTRVDFGLVQFLEHEALHAHHEQQNNPLVCTKDNNVVKLDEIWHVLCSEMLVHSQHTIKRIQTPLWKE